MPRRLFLFDDPDRFVTGTVGRPGSRTFFLQAIQGRRIASVTLEKMQVAALADRLDAILAELDRRGIVDLADTSPRGDDDRSLDEPLRDEFRVGTMTISWDPEADDLVLEARALTEDDLADDDEEEDEDGPDLEVTADAAAPDADEDEDADDPDGPDLLRVRLTPALALGFTRRAERVISAGRPPCPFCGRPLDAQGHRCADRPGSLLN
ncbi:MAG: DUF3090 domain-containing protein [Chloroflexota bacterium]